MTIALRRACAKRFDESENWRELVPEAIAGMVEKIYR